MRDKIMEHYYTQNPSGEYTLKNITTIISGIKLDFITADGVFSKSNLDYGTAVLLEALFGCHKEIGSLLDLGCGYGPIGISAALLAKAKSTMRDINERAVELAKKNAIKHKIDADISKGDGYEGINCKFDIIVTNPPIRAGKKVYYPWVEDAPNYLNEGGELWVVVQKKQGANSLRKLIVEILGNCVIAEREAGYHVLRAIKY